MKLGASQEEAERAAAEWIATLPIQRPPDAPDLNNRPHEPEACSLTPLKCANSVPTERYSGALIRTQSRGVPVSIARRNTRTYEE